MKKLNQSNRQHIARAVLNHAFATRIDAFLAEEREIQTQIIERIYPPEIRAHMDALIAFSSPAVPFDEEAALTVSVGGQRIPTGQVREWHDPKGRRVAVEDLIDERRRTLARAGTPFERSTRIPVLSRSNSYVLSVDDHDALGKRIAAHYEEREAIAAEATQKMAQITGILVLMKNDVQLKAKWPEIMPIAEQFLDEDTIAPSQLPALLTSEFNASLGLPPSNDDTLELTQVAA